MPTSQWGRSSVVRVSDAGSRFHCIMLFIVQELFAVAIFALVLALIAFEAINSAQGGRARPGRIMVLLALVTAGLSAFLDNVTTVILMVPVTFLIADALRVSPFPFLITQVMASNVGGAATLIGDPPNIIIGSASGLSFADFVVNLAPVVLVTLPPMR